MTDTPNTTQGKGAVDWTKPIEAVHEDGRVMSMAVRGTPNPYGPVATTMSPDPELTNEFWYKDGGDYCVSRSGWRIRNVPEHPTPTQYAPELVERMVAFVRRCDELSQDRSCFIGAAVPEDERWLQKQARSIVSDLAQEVDPDLLEARRIAADAIDVEGQSPTFLALIRDGTNDHFAEVRIALAALARGRQLERGDAA